MMRGTWNVERGARWPKTGAPWWLLSGVLVLCCLGWTVLSSQFHYGQGHTERPIIPFLILYLLVWLTCGAGYFMLRKSRGTGPWVLIVVAGLIARAVLLPSNLIQENDVYRYVLDGQVLLDGSNPYRYSPLVISDLGGESLRQELRRPEAQQVLSRIGYPEIPTVYPPAAQAAFAAGAWLGGWNWMGQRWAFLFIDLMVMALLLVLLRRLQVPRPWILLYAWNPLVLKEITNSAHVDVLVLMFLLLMLMGLIEQQRVGGVGWSLFSGVMMGLAILSKIYPVVLVPAAWIFLRRRSQTVWVGRAFLIAVAGTGILGVLPFVLVGYQRLTAGLTTYASRWVMNEGAFWLMSALSSHPRWVAVLLIGMVAVGFPWLRKSQDVASLVGDFQWVGLLWFLLLPSAFPWYALFLVVLLPLKPQPSGPSAATLVLSGVIGLYYLSFYYEYHGFPNVWWGITRGVEHGLIWISLALFVIYPTETRLKISTGSAMIE
ncbi:MAG: glycosyltransferase family 87 protein [Acidobacteriota bacterium]